MIMKKYLLLIFWLILGLFLLFISLQYRSRTEAMAAIVESQVSAISYQRPVIVEYIGVAPGQEIHKGDTLLIVSRPDLALDIEKKSNELEKLRFLSLQVYQDLRSKKALLKIDTEGKLIKLRVELAELEAKLNQQRKMNAQLNKLNKSQLLSYPSDSLLLMKVASIKQQMSDVSAYTNKEFERLKMRADDEVTIYDQQISLSLRELSILQSEYQSLVKIADFDGIVGVLSVQNKELVPPFKTVLSIYEIRPTLIKAFINEAISYPVSPGDEVSVVSENRRYSILGKVVELGARITSFPAKLESQSTIKSYGQEIFISISKENNFLNGEKVFVYPKEIE